jgi:DNA helicase IV
MNQEEKKLHLKEAVSNLKQTITSVRDEFKKTSKNIIKIKKGLNEFNEDDKNVQMRLLEMHKKRADELKLMEEAPYFSKCEVNFDKDKNDAIYIGKFSLTDKFIYSWISPVSKIRFEKPGNINYIRPDKTKRDGSLLQKDQFMIVDAKIMYLSTESLDNPRELVYQDYFSNQKKDFVLPEIVAQMEKAQDSVIRANYRNALLISGPAGSGKTTLAFHRIAYLLQSPDVSDKFNPNKILVLVQDVSTKKYFSHLLPELGIKNVSIVTFSEWAMSVLGLEGYKYEYRIGENEKQKDYYEYNKINSLKKLKNIRYNGDVYSILQEVYDNLDGEYTELLKKQKQHNILDRVDLTILVKLFRRTNKEITIMQEYYEMKKNGSTTRKIGRFSIRYDSVIFDEFQNYLPEQIKLIKSLLNIDNSSVMYVGDMNQQTQLGTMQDWSDIGENLPEDRKVVLTKVYRNTRQIVEYVKKLNYDINISDKLKNGDEVVEKVFVDIDDEIRYVKNNIKDGLAIGILSKDNSYLDKYREIFKKQKDVHILSMDEVQGVEFDTVFIVGVNESSILSSESIDNEDLKQEKQKVEKDLLYVALTRAMNNLFVLGEKKLSCIL